MRSFSHSTASPFDMTKLLFQVLIVIDSLYFCAPSHWTARNQRVALQADA